MTRRSLAAFADVIETWELAAHRGQLRIRFLTFGEAVNHRLRSYTYRRRLRENMGEMVGLVDNFTPESPYDTFTIEIHDPLGVPVRSNTGAAYYDLVILPRRSKGVILDDE